MERDRGRGRLRLWQKEIGGERQRERKIEIVAERNKWRETEGEED